MFSYSDIGSKWSKESGIKELMDDLGCAMERGGKIMMGGGNPAHIPEIEKIFKKRALSILHEDGAWERLLGDYDSPIGKESFRETLSDFFNTRTGLKTTKNNFAVLNGSQTAFFLLFNLFAGKQGNTSKKILFPIMPEYIGYRDQGLDEGMFVGELPIIEKKGKRSFKYHINFDALDLSDIGAMAISRPTNPSGNVLSDDELRKLAAVAEKNQIPLFIDNAYGYPFPNILFEEVNLVHGDWIINTFSLSKLGLPGARTGIVMAHEEIIERLSRANSILSLSNGSVGQALVEPLFKSGEILSMTEGIIQPYYQAQMQKTIQILKEVVPDHLPLRWHVPEGALFLWLWMEGFKMPSHEFYLKLKEKGILVVSGHHFFYGLKKKWAHSQECVRITYSQSMSSVEQGIRGLVQLLQDI